nr:swr1-complex protein 5 [Quercus suber]
MVSPTERRYHPETTNHADDDDDNDDDQYDENADEDFNPETAAKGFHGADEEDVSSDDSESDDGVNISSKKPASGKKRKATAPLHDAALDSGDEATIKERKKRRKRKDADADADDESGGEGGLIQTRAQRAAAKAERKHSRRAAAAGPGDVTIDVDAVWADLCARGVGRQAAERQVEEDAQNNDDAMEVEEAASGDNNDKPDDLIRITRTIEYAGEVTQVEERVSRTSKRGRAWLKLHPDAAKQSPTSPHQEEEEEQQQQKQLLLRPLRRPSAFEPNPSAGVKGVPADKLRPRAPSRVDVLLAAQRAAAEAKRKAEKMTTVQKSALDWQGFVAKETGLKEELEGYGKSKQGFLAREAFLDRAAGVREERGREARLLG